MPRQVILSALEREALLALPENRDDLIRWYTFSEADSALVHQRRGDANRLGFAVQLCLLRYPGQGLAVDAQPSEAVLEWISQTLRIDPSCWPQYATREETRREHLLELRAYLGLASFGAVHYRRAVSRLGELAMQTDKGVVLAGQVLDDLRQQRVIIPSLDVIERICAEAITRANRRLYRLLTDPLTTDHRTHFDALLQRKPDTRKTWLAWLRQSPGRPNSRQMLEHIERLRVLQAVDVPFGVERQVHQNRLLKIAREGGQMTAADLAKFESQRRYATLVAIVVEATATVIDEIINLHDQIISRLFNRAKHQHQQQFHESGKAINDKVRLYGKVGRALLEARQSGEDAFAAIESVIPWEAFIASVVEAQRLAQGDDFDFLPRIGEGYHVLRRYSREFLTVLKLRAAPAGQDVLAAVEYLRAVYSDHTFTLPADVPTAFVNARWGKLVFTFHGIDRRFYEICLLAELKNALRSGDIWVQGSRQFKAFDEYLLPAERFEAQRQTSTLPLAVTTDCDRYLDGRLQLLDKQLATVEHLASANDLPEAIITESGLKITPLDAAVPEAAQALIDQTATLLPRVKITELLLEVDAWTNFTRHFTHLKTGARAKDKTLLLTTVLADAINLGLTKMAECCPGLTYAKLSWLQAWHIRDETYSAALAELVNAQFRHPFAAQWGEIARIK